MSKTIFITGASSGLGKTTALLFAAKGWNVIASMRHPENETGLQTHKNITLVALDVTNVDQIKEVAERATAEHSIDVLFNNAGYGLVGALEAYTDEQIVRQIDTNLLGVIRTTKAFLPHFRQKRNGLVITTTSVAGLLCYPLGAIYHATKWALEGWSESMSHELAMHNIGIKTIAPGGIATDFMSRSLDLAQHAAYEPLLKKLMDTFQQPDSPLQFSSPESIAQVVYDAATDGRDQLRYVAGDDAQTSYAQRLAIGNENFRINMTKAFQP